MNTATTLSAKGLAGDRGYRITAHPTRRMPLLTLGQAVAANVRLIVWCKVCLHRFEPGTVEADPLHHAAETTIELDNDDKAAPVELLKRTIAG
jgi:hypothetical protein